jgi:hypothetical protein
MDTESAALDMAGQGAVDIGGRRNRRGPASAALELKGRGAPRGIGTWNSNAPRTRAVREEADA